MLVSGFGQEVDRVSGHARPQNDNKRRRLCLTSRLNALQAQVPRQWLPNPKDFPFGLTPPRPSDSSTLNHAA